MLAPQLNVQSEVTTSNAMVLTMQWDPRKALSSQLQVDEQGCVTVSANALLRDKEKAPGSFFFESEKNIFIAHLNAISALITSKKDSILESETLSLPQYYNQSNALQGLLRLLKRFQANYKNLVKFLRKAENRAKNQQFYKHLVSSDFQNLTLQTSIAQLDELIVSLREAQRELLTRNGQFDDELDDALDNPLFLLGEGLEAHIPFAEPSTSVFLENHGNPLCVGLKIDATFEHRFRHITICPSWESDTPPFIQGPSDYLKQWYQINSNGVISYTPVTLSVLMDFFENDTSVAAQPFVQTAIEIALRDDFRNLAIHASNGCWPILYALGFRTKDSESEDTVTPSEQQQTDYFAGPSITFPVSYDVTQPMVQIDANGEEFIHVTSLRLFHLDLTKLQDTPVYLGSNEPTTWHELIKSRRYLDPISHPRIVPEFNYLPYASYVPSFQALRYREINGRLPPNRIRYDTVVPDAADFNSISKLQSIGAVDELFDEEMDRLSRKMVRLGRI